MEYSRGAGREDRGAGGLERSPLLEVRALQKHYPNIAAVRGIDLVIPEGICCGLLGPNGAGKTTTVEMLEGLTLPTSGEILYRGQPCGADFRQRAGIMFQSTALPDLLTVRETLELFGAFYRTTRPLAELVERCALEGFLEQETKKLSGGQRQRLLLAIALVNDPEVLFLDEPTTGLDPQARRNFWQLVHSIKAEGKTLILTTHYMEEAAELCDEVVILDHGKVIAQGSPQGLLRNHFENTVLTLPAATVAEYHDPQLGGPEVLGIYREEREVEVITNDIGCTLKRLLALGVALDGVAVRPPNLEDLYLELTGHKLRP